MKNPRALPLLVVLLFVAVAIPVVRAATLAWYHLDGAVGTTAGPIADAGPNHVDGAVVGDATFTTGVTGEALDLAGDFDYVAVPNSSVLVLSNSWTVEFYFSAHQPYSVFGSDPATLINKLNTGSVGSHLSSFAVEYSSNGHLHAFTSWVVNQGVDVDGGANVDATDGRWHHVALVYNAAAATGDSSLSFYVDHELRDSAHGAYPPIAWAGYPLVIGTGNYPDNQDHSIFRRNFDGAMDEVRISDLALEPAGFLPPVARFIGLRIERQQNGTDVQLIWSGEAGHSYQLQYNPVLQVSGWNDLGGVQAGSGVDLEVVDPIQTATPARFYRVVQLP